MKILNIHGYHGSRENAAYSALTSLGFETVSPQTDYDRQPPEQVLGSLRDTISSENVRMLVGTSYGGLFAGVLSAETGLPAVLVNPCFLACYHLPLLGYEGDVTPLTGMLGALAELDKSRVRCIIGGSDEIVTTHEFTKRFLGRECITVVPGGMHSGATLGLTEYFGSLAENWHELQALQTQP